MRDTYSSALDKYVSIKNNNKLHPKYYFFKRITVVILMLYYIIWLLYNGLFYNYSIIHSDIKTIITVFICELIFIIYSLHERIVNVFEDIDELSHEFNLNEEIRHILYNQYSQRYYINLAVSTVLFTSYLLFGVTDIPIQLKVYTGVTICSGFLYGIFFLKGPRERREEVIRMIDKFGNITE